MTGKDITVAQEELVKARAAYEIQKKVIEAVLISNTILNAVHAGSHGSAIEQ